MAKREELKDLLKKWKQSLKEFPEHRHSYSGVIKRIKQSLKKVS